MSLIGNAFIKFEDYEIDQARWQLSWKSEPVPLTRKTFDLLMYLVDHADRVVGKDELLQTLWPGSFVEESNLSQHIFLLRKALSRHESGAKIIETVPGRGYRFAAAVQVEPPAADRMVIRAAESITRITLEEEEVDGPAAGSPIGRNETYLPVATWSRRGYWIGGGVVAVGALCVAGWFGWQRWLDHTGGAPVQVVLTPMEGTTGDGVLDKSLTQALRMDLAQSPYVSLVPDSTVRATLSMMTHKPDEVMTAATAREVCERTNSQSVLSGSLAKVGQHFLLTEEASSCVDGSVVGSAKYEADRPEDLPHGIDKLASTLRSKLGESRRSIARFDTPILPATTASLEALKDYTQGILLANQGKLDDAITFQKSALQLDPNFAAARYALAANYLTTGDYVNGRAAVTKAYEVRDTTSQPIRLSIIALYETFSTQDLFASERTYRNWTELYPRSVQAWNGLSNVQRDLGHHADSAASGLQALALRPTSQSLYVNVAHEQIRAGNLQGARATLDSAIAHNLDGDGVRANYLKLSHALEDSALMQAQTAWIEAHPKASYSRIEEVAFALEEGRLADTHRLLQEGTALLREQGLSGFADGVTKNVGANLTEAGDREAGIRLFKSVALDPEDGADLEGLLDIGDFKTAEADVQAMRSKYPQGTLWQQYYGPRVEASVALANHHPQQAIALMEATRPLDDIDPDTRKFRGDSYLAAGQPALAEKEYRAVLAMRLSFPESLNYPFSWVGLGRALAAQGKRDAAINAYQHFFTLWAHADSDATYLQQARQECAMLQQPAPAK
jgi:DNA-binding winged helix-turn-helix (wHTH) protein/tetratricopeptide (TPR) repeat protein